MNLMALFSSAVISKAALVLVTVYIAWLTDRLLRKLLNAWIKRQSSNEAVDATIASLIRVIIRVIVWVLALLFILQNLGLEITALLGGLGVAGLAIAFAFQKILEDVFSFFMIYFDKPFRVGDYIMVGADSGTVKTIGVRMTRLTTPAGQELLISNRELTTARLQNFKRLKQRRVSFTLTLDHQTEVNKIERVKTIVYEIFAGFNTDELNLERVHFKEIGDQGLVLEIAYTVANRELDVYLNAHEQINLLLLKALHREKVRLAQGIVKPSASN